MDRILVISRLNCLSVNRLQTIFSARRTPLLCSAWIIGVAMLGSGMAVAKTISSGLVDAKFVTSQTIICALLGAIVWNLLTWWFGLPSSSTHALVGGLCGAALATAAIGSFVAGTIATNLNATLGDNRWDVVQTSLKDVQDGFADIRDATRKLADGASHDGPEPAGAS